MIHARFCGNCRSTVTMSLRLAGSSLGPSPYCRGWRPSFGACPCLTFTTVADHISSFERIFDRERLPLGIDCDGRDFAQRVGDGRQVARGIVAERRGVVRGSFTVATWLNVGS